MLYAENKFKQNPQNNESDFYFQLDIDTDLKRIFLLFLSPFKSK